MKSNELPEGVGVALTQATERSPELAISRLRRKTLDDSNPVVALAISQAIGRVRGEAARQAVGRLFKELLISPAPDIRDAGVVGISMLESHALYHDLKKAYDAETVSHVKKSMGEVLEELSPQ